MAAKVRLRRATAKDAAALSELAVLTYVETYQELLPIPALRRFSEKMFTPAKTRQEFGEAGSEFYLVESPEGAACGYLKMRRHHAPEGVKGPEPIELSKIYVRKSAQGQGLGGLLFRQALDCARELGCRTLWLSVWERNEKALGFYRKLGFVPAGTREFRYYDERQTDLLLERALDV